MVARTESKVVVKKDSEKIDSYTKVVNGVISQVIDQKCTSALGSSLKRAVRPTADEAELAVIAAPLQASSISEFDARLKAMFATVHTELVDKYISEAQHLHLVLKSFLSRYTSPDELVSTMQQFPQLERWCEEFEVDSKHLQNLKERIGKRASHSLAAGLRTRGAKILSFARMEKQASAQTEVVAMNMCLEVQNLRKELGMEAPDTDFTIMRALAVMNDTMSKEATSSADLTRCVDVLSEAEKVLDDDNVSKKSLCIGDDGIKVIHDAIRQGKEAASLAQMGEREKRPFVFTCLLTHSLTFSCLLTYLLTYSNEGTF